MKYAQPDFNITAANRFGYGRLYSNANLLVSDAKASLISGLILPTFNSQLPSSIEIGQKLAEYRALKKTAKMNKTVLSKTQKSFPRQTYFKFVEDSITQILRSEQTIQWRLLDFFSNHFSVTAQGNIMTPLAPTLEREAIAPNLFGRFEDMLLAVEQHPAMILYLNNEKSFGPNSKMGRRGRGLNENLAREILELHTLGVDGGYTQSDVLELAKGISGWSVANPVKEPGLGFVYRSNGHEPGTRTLLNKSYKANGIEQGKEMLKSIARHPSTKNYVCTKLAKHFVSDQPPKSLIDKLETTWQKSNGNIKSVMLTLIDSDESWAPGPAKFKTPRDYIFSTFRAINPKKMKSKQVYQVLKQFGQAPFNSGSPAGYPDSESEWLSGNSLMNRIDLATELAARYKPNAEKLLNHVFANTISEHSYLAIVRAESRQQATSLFLLSPEFLRR